jgi:hypothetical protein
LIKIVNGSNSIKALSGAFFMQFVQPFLPSVGSLFYLKTPGVILIKRSANRINKGQIKNN